MIIRRWFGWWKTSRPRCEHLALILYTRQGCHLCDIAWKQLHTAQEHWGFRLVVVDVDSDPDLAARYGEQVPVVSVNGVVRFRGVINRALLNRLLRAESRRRP
jgi:hypothetical protein